MPGECNPTIDAGEDTPASHRGDNKFRPDVPTFVYHGIEVYRKGIMQRVGKLTRSVRQEFEENEKGVWEVELKYVNECAARESYPSTKGEAPTEELVPSYTRDLDHTGYRIEDFWNAQPAKLRGTPDELTRAEITLLRVYTGPWFEAFNFNMRYGPFAACCSHQPYHPHYDARRLFLRSPSDTTRCILCGKERSEHVEQRLDSWATSAAILYSGILKLSTVSNTATVYRGVKEDCLCLPDSFIFSEERYRRGEFAAGVEPGPMSTTFDKKVATGYAGDGYGSLFEITFTADTRGASLKFLSQYPEEDEMVFPPCTLLECMAVEALGGDKRRLLKLRATVNPDTLLQECVAQLSTIDARPELARSDSASDSRSLATSLNLSQPLPPIDVPEHSPSEEIGLSPPLQSGERSVMHSGHLRFSATADQLYERATEEIKKEAPDFAKALKLFRKVHEVLEKSRRNPKGFRHLDDYTIQCEDALGQMREGLSPPTTPNARNIAKFMMWMSSGELKTLASPDDGIITPLDYSPSSTVVISATDANAYGQRLDEASWRAEQLQEINTEQEALVVAEEAAMKPAHAQLLKRYATRTKLRAAKTVIDTVRYLEAISPRRRWPKLTPVPPTATACATADSQAAAPVLELPPRRAASAPSPTSLAQAKGVNPSSVAGPSDGDATPKRRGGETSVRAERRPTSRCVLTIVKLSCGVELEK
jgi:hypothetical protein